MIIRRINIYLLFCFHSRLALLLFLTVPRNQVLERLHRLPKFLRIFKEVADKSELQQGVLHVRLVDGLAELPSLILEERLGGRLVLLLLAQRLLVDGLLLDTTQVQLGFFQVAMSLLLVQV